jgi:flagellar hook-associated protein 3 FlgL
MIISGVANNISPVIQSVLEMRKQLDDLQRQLGTGQKAELFSGLGSQSTLATGLSAQIEAISSFDDTMTIVGTRTSIAQTALGQISDVASQVKAATLLPNFNIDATGQTSEQKTATDQLDQVLSLLNSQVGDRYMFSGTAVTLPAVDTTDHILNGNGAQAGLRQLISERNQADLGGPGGLGRLSIPAAVGTNVAMSETLSGPFGFKLAGVTSTLTGAVVTGPAGAPPSINVNFAVNPNAGDKIKFTFNLPDGSTEDLVLEATTSATPGPGQFTIGPNPNQTAINFQAALTTAVDTLANTALSAASAVAAAGNFFANPPMRVAPPPPFTAATALVAGTPANTIQWYIGENGPNPPRSTAVARIDPSITVQYGMRANEQGIAWIVQQVATLAATTYSPANPNDPGSYAALNQRLDQALSIPLGVQKIDDIQASIASAQTAMQTTKDRHQQTNKTLTDMLQSIEGVDQNQVGVQILALQTSLQASFQTTAMLSQLSLVKVL